MGAFPLQPTKENIQKFLKENPLVLQQLKAEGQCLVPPYLLLLDRETGRISLSQPNSALAKTSPLVENFRQAMEEVLLQEGPEKMAGLISALIKEEKSN